MKKKKNQKQKKMHKGMGIQQKLMLIIIPFFVIAFLVTAGFMFTYSAKSLLETSKYGLATAAQATKNEVIIDLLNHTKCSSAESAFARTKNVPINFENMYQSISNTTIMEEGHVMLINTDDNTILAHHNEHLRNTVTTNYAAGTFIGDVAALIATGNTELNTVADVGTSYYTIVSFIEGTPWVLVSYLSEDYVLSDLYAMLSSIVIVFAIVMVISIAVISLSIRQMLHPIKSLNQVLTTITDGDFTVDVKSKGSDEVATMSRSLKDFVDIMREIILDIRNVSTSSAIPVQLPRQLQEP